jgi:hypothetical protein
MAATWVAQASVTTVATRSMLALYNGGSDILRCYRYCIFNTQTSAITAALSVMSVRRLTALTVGTTCTPVKHDTNSSALSGSVTCGSSNATVTATDVFRRFLWLLEEATTTGTTQANWEVLVPVGIIFFPTGGDSNLESIVCRNGYGTDIYNVGSGAVGVMEYEITFTNAAS